MNKKITVTDLFNAKIHFGHTKKFVSPKMVKYVHEINNKISIINLDLTLKLLTQSLNFIENIIKNNGTILFVGTKRQASKIIKNYSEKISMPYVENRWLGGLLTNYKTIKNSINKLKELEANIENNNFKHLTKKEMLNTNKQLNKLKIKFNGIKNMENLPDALFIIDVNYEKTALLEATKLKIPVIGIVDTNSDPDKIDYIIPGNDDSTDSINFFLNIITEQIINIKKIKEGN
ncbi:MAG TPA: 30S ribosomal protein S2 [Candidatus Azoamicus sp.]